MSKDLRDIVAEWLENHGYDGLASPDCGCLLDDLMPCEYPLLYECVPGYKAPCPGPDDCPNDGDCDFHVSPQKPLPPPKPKLQKILSNKARCKRCGDVIESKYCHDFVTCSCGALSVDGGKDYIKRCVDTSDGNPCEELSEFERTEDKHG